MSTMDKVILGDEACVIGGEMSLIGVGEAGSAGEFAVLEETEVNADRTDSKRQASVDVSAPGVELVGIARLAP
jgi:hypothetical protein